MYNEKLNDSSIQVFSQALKFGFKTKTIQLGRNNITHISVLPLVDSLLHLKINLVWLGLSFNLLGDRGAEIISNLLQNNKKSLNLY